MCKNSVLWEASVTERERARPKNARVFVCDPVTGEQWHQFTIHAQEFS